MASKYNDLNATLQVMSCVYNNPNLLGLVDNYFFDRSDFPDKLHMTIFGAINNLYQNGATKIGVEEIVNYLQQRPNYYTHFRANKGEDFLDSLSEIARPEMFNFHYGRMKKMTLLREYDRVGVDVSWLYDPDNILDIKKKQKQEDWIDNSSLADIAVKIDERISEIREKYVDNTNSVSQHSATGMRALKENLKVEPEIGVPLYGSLINRVSRGARLKKFYLRSAPTGCGKSRTMVADACNIGCTELYDPQLGWMKNGSKEPVSVITTELEVEEVQTMMMAFLSGVNEDHILDGKYDEGEEVRVDKAIDIIEESNIQIDVLPDFSLQDIENVIRKNVREHDCKYIFFDYIHTSLKILEEISKRTGGMKLREDNILFMLSIKLKDLCNELGVFILSATQLNGDWQDAKEPNQNLLRGAKSIADKIDLGSIILPVTDADREALNTVPLASEVTHKIAIYKNRRGQYKSVILWCKGNLGVCRLDPLFATGYNYQIINDMSDLAISVEEAPSAW